VSDLARSAGVRGRTAAALGQTYGSGVVIVKSHLAGNVLGLTAAGKCPLRGQGEGRAGSWGQGGRSEGNGHQWAGIDSNRGGTGDGAGSGGDGGSTGRIRESGGCSN